MADVRVDVKDATIISALNTPGGAVYEWRNDRERQVLAEAYGKSPVNRPENAIHRGGVVGVFKASWVTRRQGNGHRIGFNIENFADHAIYVEEGRSASTKYQVFPGALGDVIAVGRPARPDDETMGPGTKARDGRHVLKNAVNAIGASTGDWGPLG